MSCLPSRLRQAQCHAWRYPHAAPPASPCNLQVAPVVKSAVETAAPVVKEGVKATAEVVAPALQVRCAAVLLMCAVPCAGQRPGVLVWRGACGARTSSIWSSFSPRVTLGRQRSVWLSRPPGTHAAWRYNIVFHSASFVAQTGLKEAEKVLSASGVDTSAAKPLVETTEQVRTMLLTN